MDEHLTAAQHISGCNRATKQQEPLWTTVNTIRGEANAAHFTAFHPAVELGSLTSTKLKCWLPRTGTYRLGLTTCACRRSTAFGCLHGQVDTTGWMHVPNGMHTPDKCITCPSEITWISPKPKRTNIKCITDYLILDFLNLTFSGMFLFISTGQPGLGYSRLSLEWGIPAPWGLLTPSPTCCTARAPQPKGNSILCLYWAQLQPGLLHREFVQSHHWY